MWLQGGPGASSMYGLFTENGILFIYIIHLITGPFSVSPDGQSLVPREITWNSDYHMLYVDNPVGAGFRYIY